MRGSFQDQLLKLGITDKQKADAVKKEQHQAKKQAAGKKQAAPVIDENARLAEEALAKKRERAHQLNLEREAKLRKREEETRVRQLIESSRLPQDQNGTPFRFADQGKIYRVFVGKETASQLSYGRAAIVRLGDRYEVVDREAAAKIRATHPQLIIFEATAPESSSEEDDPYREFKVPDDLMW